jgi:hypothetical protein
MKDVLPGANKPVTVIDDSGRSYRGRVGGARSRINGLGKLHRALRTAPGVELGLRAEPDGVLRVAVVGGDEAQQQPEEAVTLTVERDLEEFLCRNLTALERGLRIYKPDGRQFKTDVGFIDILAEDAHGLVVIELKAGTADDSALGQLQGYMGDAETKTAAGRPVRGIIVAGDFSPRLLAAASRLPDVTLKRYTVSFALSDVRRRSPPAPPAKPPA